MVINNKNQKIIKSKPSLYLYTQTLADTKLGSVVKPICYKGVYGKNINDVVSHFLKGKVLMVASVS